MEQISLAAEAEKDPRAQAQLSALQQEARELNATQQDLSSRWEEEKGRLVRLSQLKEEIERVGVEIDQAEQEYELQKAAELKCDRRPAAPAAPHATACLTLRRRLTSRPDRCCRRLPWPLIPMLAPSTMRRRLTSLHLLLTRYGRLPQLRQELEQAEAEAAAPEGDDERALLRKSVAEGDVATVLEQWTGIPSERMLAAEAEKILSLPDALAARVKGQPVAVEAVAEAIMRSRAGLSDPSRPLASFLFLGPTGVGKTELAKTLAAALFDDEEAMVRLDMSDRARAEVKG